MAPDVFFWLQHVFSSSSVSTEFKIARIPCEGFLAMPASIVYVYVVGVHKDTLVDLSHECYRKLLKAHFSAHFPAFSQFFSSPNTNGHAHAIFPLPTDD
jgi:hypothetical protein